MTDMTDLTAPVRAGSGDVGVVFCHGFTGSPMSLREWAERTADAGHRVSLPRLPGHATTWRELDVTTWQDWYGRVEREYLSLRRDCERVFVAGLSMGGTLALRLAERHPDVAGAMVANPALALTDRRALLAPVLKRFITSTASIGNDIARPGINERSYDRTPMRALHELLKLIVDVRTTLDLITCPLLIFRSAVDNVVSGTSVDIIQRQASSTDIRIVELANSLHVATMDIDREQIFADSAALIDEITARR